VKVLVADDDPVVRALLTSNLAKWDYEVLACGDGLDAWTALQGDEAPPLAILDWIMPSMDGVEVCRRVRSLGRRPYTYIILLTVKGGREEILQGLEAGADDYIVKPFDPSELRVRIRGAQRILTLQQDLAKEITVRKEAEKSLKKSNDELERRVTERTFQLSKVNESLRTEIEERRRTEELLSASLKEKEILLEEIHHRVKNNLQIISSLLALQSSYFEDARVLEALADSQSRVRSMALIHEQLYRSENLTKIDFPSYLRKLTGSLCQSYAADRGDLKINVQSPPVSLNMATAITCGLIVNELVSNSLKHAFRERKGGEVSVGLFIADNGDYVLTVADDGCGFPAHLDFKKAKSLGMRLVTSLAERQLRGRLEIDGSRGAMVRVTFKELPESKGGRL
jgi:two-component sensor histidine kinase/DNA-binding NarL/FixJ family response regulator